MSNVVVDIGAGGQEAPIQAGSGQISMQQFQHIYNQLTGKNEKISKASNKAIRLKSDDLLQVDKKIRQTLEQYNVIGMNSVYVVYFANGEKENFSSYEKFAMQVASHNEATESIYFKYELSILLPLLKQVQSYTITVRVLNRLELQKKFLRDMPFGASRAMVNYATSKTVEFSVEYVDFAVSRTIMAALDSWLGSLDETAENWVLKICRKISHFIPPLLKYSGVCFLTWGVMDNIDLIYKDLEGYAYLVKYQVYLALTFFLTWRFLGFLGKIVEDSVDSTCDISFVSLTRGDQKAVELACKESKIDVIKACVTGAVSGVASFMAKYLILLIR
jgi:hypothetical protein